MEIAFLILLILNLVGIVFIILLGLSFASLLVQIYETVRLIPRAQKPRDKEDKPWYSNI
jgi:hypothetical protein